MRILPDDEANRTLVRHTHPPEWVNPEPRGRYNLVVIAPYLDQAVAQAIRAQPLPLKFLDYDWALNQKK